MNASLSEAARAALSPTRLLLAGDAVDRWEALATWVTEAFALAGGTERVVSAESADVALRAHPGDRLLYFAARPEQVLKGAEDAEAALTAWATRARAILRLVHAHPGRCLLVDIDDADASPADLLAGVADWLETPPRGAGTGAPASAPASAPADDPLWRLAAAASIEARDPIAALAMEWTGSCIPLGPMDRPAAAAGDAALAALVHSRALQASTSQALRQVTAERDEQAQRLTEQSDWARALERDVRRLEDALSSLDGEHARRATELAAARGELNRTESDLLLLRAQVDQLLEASDGLTARATRAETGLAAAQAGLAAAHAELAAAHADLDLARRTAADAVAARQTDRQALEAEREALMASVLMAHSEAAAAQSLNGALEPAPVSAAPPVALSGITLLQVRGEPPHRELHFRLTGVLTPHGELPALDLRLVDHHGRPGLVIVGGGAVEPISGWQPTGVEEGRPYMLIVPSDAAGARALDPLPSADWTFLHGLVELLATATAEPDFGLPPHWRPVALRLLTQLDRLPRRLRYNRLDLAGDAATGAVDIRLEGVLFGAETLPAVHLRWRPQGSGLDPDHCVLAWSRPDDPDAAPPLALWPQQSDGLPAPALVFPFGTGFTAAVQRRWWSAHPEADRDLLLSLLDVLPAAAERAGSPIGPTAAAALRKQARSTLRTLRLRRFVARLRRR